MVAMVTRNEISNASNLNFNGYGLSKVSAKFHSFITKCTIVWLILRTIQSCQLQAAVKELF